MSTKISIINIPNYIFSNTLENFQKAGNERKESIAYWSGKIKNSQGYVHNVIFADQYPEFENYEHFARLPIEASFKVGSIIHDRQEILLAQIHSHPAEAFHSETDDTYTISHKVGFISIVVPYFGKHIQSIEECKVYEHLGAGKWKDLSMAEINSRIKIKTEERKNE